MVLADRSPGARPRAASPAWARVHGLLAGLHAGLNPPGVRRAALVLLGLLGLLGARLTWDGLMPDVQLFAAAGNDLLTGHWGEVFADPTLQAGPVILLLSAVLAHLGGAATIALAGPPVLALLAVRATSSLRAAVGLEPRPAIDLVAGSTILLWELGQGGVHSGHLSQLIVPVLWLTAGIAARRGHAVLAGAVLGLSLGCETWGVLAAPVLLLSGRGVDAGGPDRRTVQEWLRGGLALLTVTALLYLPFALTGSFRMFQFRWLVGSETIYGQLVPGLATAGFPWWARCLQAAAALTACALIAWLRRADPAAVWLAPLAAVLVRLLLDPVGMGYYWTAGVVLLVAGATVSTPRPAAVAVLACWWQFLPAGRIWFGTGLVSLPLLVLLVLLPAETDRSGCRDPD